MLRRRQLFYYSEFIKSFKNPSLSIIKAGYGGGQPKEGVEEGPDAVIRNDFVKELQRDAKLNTVNICSNDYDFYKTQTVKCRSSTVQLNNGGSSAFANLKNAEICGQVSQRLHENSMKCTKDGSFVITVGGDHSIATGTISGMLARYGPSLGVIWVDAHADINTPKTTPSGNLHGCPASFLLNHSETKGVPGYEWLNKVHSVQSSWLSPDRLVYIGLRDVDEAEKSILKSLNIKAFSMTEIDQIGIQNVMQETLAYLGNGTNPLHLSFDIDGLDPIIAPSTGTPVLGGLSLREGRLICEMLHQSNSFVGMDLVEVNPLIGSDPSNTINSARILIRAALGCKYLK